MDPVAENMGVPTPNTATEPVPANSAAPADVPVWTRAAQKTAAALLFALGLLLCWHVYSLSAWSTKPLDLTQDYRIDLNRADLAALVQLPGVGESLARRILEKRREKQGFRFVEELLEVQGIGKMTFERLKDHVFVEPLDGTEEAEDEAAIRPAKANPNPGTPSKPSAKMSGSSGKKTEQFAGPIDVNRASAEELQNVLPGIGATLAELIVQTRKLRPFATVEELRRVPGIGTKTLERLRPLVKVGPLANDQ